MACTSAHDIVLKAYDCFGKGDMDTFKSLVSGNFVMHLNGMHKLSGTYNGWDNWFSGLISKMPIAFPGFKFEIKNSFANDTQVFVHVHATSDEMDAQFGHYFRVENEKIAEFYAFDDSQKMAHAMKAIV